MPASVLTALADEVLALVSPAVIAAGGTATREYVPENELAELSALVVSVVPLSSTRERIARKVWRRDYNIGVSVQNRASMQIDIDALTALTEALSDVLEGTDPPTVPVSLVESEVTGPDAGHLKQMQVFTAVIVATYRGGRAQT